MLWGLDQVNLEEKIPDCPVKSLIGLFLFYNSRSQVCDVKFSKELQVFQCAGGHFLCGDCRARLEPDHCPVCRRDIIGRAGDFERFLRGLHGDSE